MFQRFIDWIKSLFAKKEETSVIPPLAVPIPKKPVIEDVDANTPWMKWMKQRKGWDETNNDKQLAVYWKYTNVPYYKTVRGVEHAWCAMIVCAALEETGYKSSRDAAAASFDRYGTKLDKPKYGCVITVHRSGGSGRHVTFFYNYDENGDLICLGGNQGDEINYTVYPIERLVAARWPVKK